MAASIVHQSGDIVAASAMTPHQDATAPIPQEAPHTDNLPVRHYHYQDHIHVSESATDLRYHRPVEENLHGATVLDMRRKIVHLKWLFFYFLDRFIYCSMYRIQYILIHKSVLKMHLHVLHTILFSV